MIDKILWKICVFVLAIFIVMLSIMSRRNTEMIVSQREMTLSQQEVIRGLVETDTMIVGLLDKLINETN